MSDVPVALFVFNRPDVTRRTVEAIARARPRWLAVVADGPRSDDDKASCEEVRRIATAVDWPCELVLNLATTNLGCRTRMASGLDWLFTLFDKAIILEDDCLPAPSFFPFCDELLERYRDVDEVTMIGGSAPHGGIDGTYSYFFSRYTLIWGWATWRRAWLGYDVDMMSWPQMRDNGSIEGLFEDDDEWQHWRDRFDRTHAGHSTWDHQWTFRCWQRGGLAALPTTNLVTNIGFGPDATHTKSRAAAARLSVPSGAITFPLRHPKAVHRCATADRRIYREILNPEAS